MYHFANLSQIALRALTNIQSAQLNTTRAFCLGLAYVISRELSVPTEEMEDTEQYYRLQHALSVEQMVSSINEIVPFDFKRTIEDVKAFYKHRLSTLYPQAVPLAINPEKALPSFFGLTLYFSDEALETISTCGDKLTLVISTMTPVYQDLKAKRQEYSAPIERDAITPPVQYPQ